MDRRIFLKGIFLVIVFLGVYLYVNLKFAVFTVIEVNTETRICTMETHHGRFLLNMEDNDMGVEEGEVFIGTCPSGGDPNPWGYEGSEHSPD